MLYCLWGNTSANKQGNELKDVLAESNLPCINGDDMTRMASRPVDSDSTVDLVLVRFDLGKAFAGTQQNK